MKLVYLSLAAFPAELYMTLGFRSVIYLPITNRQKKNIAHITIILDSENNIILVVLLDTM